jgi:hypothetical protein
MTESKKTVVEEISALSEKLVTLEKKMDSYGGDLSQVQTKVDLTMQSILLVQQE